MRSTLIYVSQVISKVIQSGILMHLEYIIRYLHRNPRYIRSLRDHRGWMQAWSIRHRPALRRILYRRALSVTAEGSSRPKNSRHCNMAFAEKWNDFDVVYVFPVARGLTAFCKKLTQRSNSYYYWSSFSTAKQGIEIRGIAAIEYVVVWTLVYTP